MDAFGDYARCYDGIYQSKNYKAECDFLGEIFKTFAHGPIHCILDLGCGTGGHAIPLAQRSYSVTGVDLSERMVEKARAKAAKAGLSITFRQGDIQCLKLGQTFDVVIAMFAVISYQITNVDLAVALKTARRHLNSGGLFIFDVWYGPAVLTERPSDRLKIVETNGERLIRFAKPVLDVVKQTVQVNYKVLRLKGSQVLDEVDESHLMRFLFPQEITHYLEIEGFRMLHLCPFMELDRELTERDWNVSIVAEAV